MSLRLSQSHSSSALERGARNPTILVLEQLAKPLGVTPGRLLD